MELTADERDALASLVHVGAGTRSTGTVAAPAGAGSGGSASGAALTRILRSCSVDDAFLTPLSISAPESPRRVDGAAGA